MDRSGWKCLENQTEVIRVPQHNDVDAMEIMNDFNAVSQELQFPLK